MTIRSIVLAAGRGRRLSSVTGGVPKQFWAPDGSRSLVEETVSRFSAVVPDERVVTIVGDSHRPFVEAIEARRSLGEVIYQPGDAGTAAGVLLGVKAIAARDPHAHVLITPSDHAVRDAKALVAGVLAGASAVRHRQSEIVLFGVRPISPAGDYGWIAPAPHRAGARADSLRAVAAFVEKPAPELASRLFESGAVWNTMVMIARVESLIDLYRTHLPAMTATFDEAFAAPASERRARLEEAYARMAPADFSRDLLMPARGLDFYTWSHQLGWTDLGTPARLAAWYAGLDNEGPRREIGLAAAS